VNAAVARKSVNEKGGNAKVSVKSAIKAAVAGDGVLGRSRAILSRLHGRHSGEGDEPPRLRDIPIVVC